MTTRDDDMFMFMRFVLPVIASQAKRSTPDKRAAESAVFTEVADSPYAYLVPILHPESVNGS